MRINGYFRRASYVAGLTMALTLAPTAAFGAWLSNGDGSTGVTATSVNKASKPTVTPGTGLVTISWETTTLASGDFVGRYLVFRDGGATPVCSSTSVTTATASCADNSPVPQQVTYTVVAAIGANWTGPASDGTQFTYDTTAPVAPDAPDLVSEDDTGMSNTDNVTSRSAVTVTGTAEPGSTVRIYRGDDELGSGTAEGGNYSISILLVEGENTIHATATDSAGNVSVSSDLTIIVSDSQIAAPSAPDLDAVDDTGASDADDITNRSSVTVTGTAEAGSAVVIYRGTMPLGSTTAIGDGSYSVEIALVEGMNEVHAQADDTAGNSSDPSTPLTVTLDTQAPAAPGTPDLTAADDSGSLSTDDITNKTSVTVTGTATEAGSTVRIYRGATELGSATVAGGGYSVSVALVEGENPILATATDVSGNESGTSGTQSLSLDTSSPEVGVSKPTEGTTYQNNNSGGNSLNWQRGCAVNNHICGTAVDAGTSVPSLSYTLKSLSGSTTGQCWTGSGAAFDASCSPLALVPTSGSWTTLVGYNVVAGKSLQLTVTAVDRAGNATSVVRNFAAQ